MSMHLHTYIHPFVLPHTHTTRPRRTVIRSGIINLKYEPKVYVLTTLASQLPQELTLENLTAISNGSVT